MVGSLRSSRKATRAPTGWRPALYAGASFDASKTFTLAPEWYLIGGRVYLTSGTRLR